MNVYKCETMMTVGDAPVGLFQLDDDGEIICISEYYTGEKRDAIIVSSGENYFGEGNAAYGYPLTID